MIQVNVIQKTNNTVFSGHNVHESLKKNDLYFYNLVYLMFEFGCALPYVYDLLHKKILCLVMAN